MTTTDVDCSTFSEIKGHDQLFVSVPQSLLEEPESSSVVMVIKPNQNMNVIMRALRSIANMNPEGLKHTHPSFLRVSSVEFLKSYTQ